MFDSLRRMDEWIEMLGIALVVAAVGVAATVPRIDRDAWDGIVAMNASASSCATATGRSAANCALPTAIDP